MYLLTFHARPKNQINKNNGIGGAYINCWIEELEYEKAEEAAVAEIERAGWTIIDLDEAYEISREDYNTNDTGLKYFEQALIDKQVFVYHTYPLEN